MHSLASLRGCLRLHRPCVDAYTGVDMDPVFARIFKAALVLLMVVTGQGMAVARAAPGPAGQIELCTGTGPVMVYVDENGEPVGAPHICPDYALSLILHVAAPDVALHLVETVRRLSAVREDLQSPVARQPHTVARGPPVLV